MTDTATNLETAIEQAASQYYRLVVLAGVPGSGKTAALQSVSQNVGSKVHGRTGTTRRSCRWRTGFLKR